MDKKDIFRKDKMKMMKKRIVPLFVGGLFTIISCLGCGTGVNASEILTWPEFPVSSEAESETEFSSETETESLNSDWHRLSESELDQIFGDLPRYLDLGSFTPFGKSSTMVLGWPKCSFAFK